MTYRLKYKTRASEKNFFTKIPRVLPSSLERRKRIKREEREERERGKNGLTSRVSKQSQGVENQVTKIETRLGDPCRGRKSRKQEVHLISRRWAEGETGRTRHEPMPAAKLFFIHCPPSPKGFNHACAHVLEENRSRIRCTLAVDPSPA